MEPLLPAEPAYIITILCVKPFQDKYAKKIVPGGVF